MSRRNDIYSSWENTAIPQFPDDMAREDIDLQRFVMLNMDGEHHDRLRRIISPVSPLGPSIVCATNSITAPRTSPRRRPRRAVAISSSRLLANCRFRLSPICWVFPRMTAKLFRWSNEMTGNDDSNSMSTPKRSSMEVLAYAMQMAEVKAKEPGRTSSPL